MRNVPDGPVTARRVSCVARLTAVTCAPATAAPPSPVTVPSSVIVVCACSVPAHAPGTRAGSAGPIASAHAAPARTTNEVQRGMGGGWKVSIPPGGGTGPPRAE